MGIAIITDNSEWSGRRSSMPNADDTADNIKEATVAIACQGGGSHAAYTAGVLKAILRHQATRPYRIIGFSGTSGGAICALLAWYGQLQAGPNTPEGAAKAGELLEAFWHTNAASSLWERVVNWWAVESQRLPVEVRLSPYELPLKWNEALLASWSPRREFVDLKALLAAHVSFPAIEAIGRFQAIEAELRTQRRRQGLRALIAVTGGRAAMEDSLEEVQKRVARANSAVRRLDGFERVKEVLQRATSRIQTRTQLEDIEVDLADARRQLPVLLVGAVDVLAGTFKAFSSVLGEISVDSVAASACLPWMFRAQQVNDDFYWDGLFSQNPPILNFVSGQEGARDKPDEIWVVQINPQVIQMLPTAADSIQDRRARLTGNLSLNQEIEAIEAVNRWVADGSFTTSGQHKVVAIHRVEMDAARLPTYHPLDTASKVERERSFLRALVQHGEAQAALFWPVRCFVEEVVNGRASASWGEALEGSVAPDVVLRFPPRWPQVRGRDAVGKMVARWRDAFSEKGHSSLHVAILRMEAHHGRATRAGVFAPPEPADSITWELDWGAWGRLAGTSRRPATLVRLEGTALATVTRNRLSDITIQALDAVRVEHAQCTPSRMR
jgi:predicted acylesterase/phospholipase RssA